MKKIIIVILILCAVMTLYVDAAVFSDVKGDSEYYEAVKELSKKGIINGYNDGTFKPDGEITRAETAAIIVRAANLKESSAESIYTDVRSNHWACKSIMAATDEGIIQGMGDNIFSPNGEVTHFQVLKMIICMMGLEKDAEKNGGWPLGYEKVAYVEEIIDWKCHNKLVNNNFGSAPATRGDVACYIYNALEYKEKNTLSVSGKTYYIGQKSDLLETPDEKIASTAGFIWYVYGTKTYEGFFAAGVSEERIVALVSAGIGFEYRKYKAGDIMPEENDVYELYTDSNDDNKVHAVKITTNNYDIFGMAKKNITKETLEGESKMNFHFTNAFRVFHGKEIMKWSNKAAESARLHSEDMADNNYFSHSSLDGRRMSERMEAQGILWCSCAENIAAGSARYMGFDSYDGWVNSEGHRINMLSDNVYLGVGIAYNKDSKHSFYHTQNFFTDYKK